MLASQLLRQPGFQLRRQLASRRAVPTLPSALRQGTRAFHVTAPRKDAVDVFIEPAHQLLQCLHMGLPWYAAIPVSALVVRSLLVGTLGVHTRTLAARTVALAPLRNAIAIGTRDRMMKAGKGHKTPRDNRLAFAKEIRKNTTALDKRWNCNPNATVFWTFMQLPIFLMMVEAIRRMLGTKDGLLRMASNAVGWTKPSETSASIVTNHYGTDVQLNHWFEPSLANEGMLWFTDLVVPDSTGVLPFVVSGLMFTNVYLSGDPENVSKFKRRLRRFLMVVSLMIGPLCQDVPSGLLLYWASSTSSVMLSHAIMDWRYPIVQGFAPCKRPLFDYTPPKTMAQRPVSAGRPATPPKAIRP